MRRMVLGFCILMAILMGLTGIACADGDVCEHVSTSFYEEEYDVSFSSQGLNVHERQCHVRQITQCDICQEIISAEEIDGVRTSTESHRYELRDDNWICSDCGQINTCEHSGKYSTTNWQDDCVCEEIEGNNLKHTITGTVEYSDFCPDCGMYLNVRIVENESGQIEHCYEEGVCTECGHVNTCTHENSEKNYWINSADEAEYTAKEEDAGYHLVSGIGGWVESCPDCGKVTSENDIMVSYQEQHSFIYDAEQNRYICEKCHSVCEHAFRENDPTCIYCGMTCYHESIDMAEVKTRESEMLVWKDDSCHQFFACTETYKVCPVCKAEVILGQEATGEATGKEEHHFLDGTCVDCHSGCPHSRFLEELEKRIPLDEMRNGMIDEYTHGYGTCVGVYNTCQICQEQVMLSYYLTELAQEEEAHPHTYDEWGTCTACSYQCQHGNWENGRCTTCHSECHHIQTEIVERWTDDTVFTQVDYMYHHAKGTQMKDNVCLICGTVLDTYEEPMDTDIGHSWNGLNAGTAPNVCEFCGMTNDCTHVNQLSYPDWQGAVYQSLGESGHRTNGAATIIERCNDCGVILSETYYESYQADEAHSFDGTGKCYFCGYECPHDNTQPITSIYNEDEAVYQAVDNATHNKKGTGTTYDYCEDCYSSLNVLENQEIVLSENHSYVYDAEKDAYVCSLCGHQCTHDFDENGCCTRCGASCEHNWENGRCTICHYECDHSWTLTAERWTDDTVFTQIDHMVHHVIGTRMTDNVCQICGTILDTYEEPMDTDIIHSWYGLNSGTAPNVCEFCGMTNDCTHVNQLSYPDWQDAVYQSLGESGHRINGSATIIGRCNDCGVILSETYYESYQAEEAHSFDNAGVCYDCGYTCLHEHTQPQTFIYDDAEITYLSVDNATHIRKGKGKTYDYCENCYASLNVQENQEIVDLPEYHTYVYDTEKDAYICSLCEHQCTHDFDENGSCVSCGFSCPHETWGDVQSREETGRFLLNLDESKHNVYGRRIVHSKYCKVCGFEQIENDEYYDLTGCESHEYHDGSCACGAVCPHHGIENEETILRTTSEPSWVNKDGVHHVLATLNQTWAVCPVCGQEAMIHQKLPRKLKGAKKNVPSMKMAAAPGAVIPANIIGKMEFAQFAAKSAITTMMKMAAVTSAITSVHMRIQNGLMTEKKQNTYGSVRKGM